MTADYGRKPSLLSAAYPIIGVDPYMRYFGRMYSQLVP
jgi:hypothetical protein